MLTTVLVVLVLVVAFGFIRAGDRSRSIPLTLEVVGDVRQRLAVTGPGDLDMETETLPLGERTVEAVSLEPLLEAVAPTSPEFRLLLIGRDGRSAVMCNTHLSVSRIGFGDKHGWEMINENHPPSGNIKNLATIVVIDDTLTPEKSFNVIQPGHNLVRSSVGEMFARGYRVVYDLRGVSTQQHEGVDLEVTSLDRRRVVDLDDVLHPAQLDGALVVGERGEISGLRQDGQMILGSNQISYWVGGEIEIDDVRGLVLDPPEKMITDVYHDTMQLLDDGEQVLLILVDGLGYHQYTHVVDNGRAPFMASLPQPMMAMNAYPAVTPVNVAAALTGVTPDVNGIYRRGLRTPEVPTIFARTAEEERKATAIMGPIQVMDLEIPAVLCTDTNDDGSTDDEILEAALERMDDDYDLLLVHFKDVDRAGHNYGDLAGETLEQIRRIDGYVDQLVSRWQGKVVIFSDHGMHTTEDGGDHGWLITEDMFTPYWLLDGGEIDE